jgi:energy-converting hydrogenase B subunit D
MTVVQAVALILVALGALGVVTSREPMNQAIAASFYGLLLSILFFVFRAPDVALSQIVVGAIATPLMIVLALAKIRGGAE